MSDFILDANENMPAAEAWLFKNEEVLQSVLRGLQQSSESNTQYLGSFSEHATD